MIRNNPDLWYVIVVCISTSSFSLVCVHLHLMALLNVIICSLIIQKMLWILFMYYSTPPGVSFNTEGDNITLVYYCQLCIVMCMTKGTLNHHCVILRINFRDINLSIYEAHMIANQFQLLWCKWQHLQWRVESTTTPKKWMIVHVLVTALFFSTLTESSLVLCSTSVVTINSMRSYLQPSQVVLVVLLLQNGTFIHIVTRKVFVSQYSLESLEEIPGDRWSTRRAGQGCR